MKPLGEVEHQPRIVIAGSWGTAGQLRTSRSKVNLWLQTPVCPKRAFNSSSYVPYSAQSKRFGKRRRPALAETFGGSHCSSVCNLPADDVVLSRVVQRQRLDDVPRKPAIGPERTVVAILAATDWSSAGTALSRTREKASDICCVMSHFAARRWAVFVAERPAKWLFIRDGQAFRWRGSSRTG